MAKKIVTVSTKVEVRLSWSRTRGGYDWLLAEYPDVAEAAAAAARRLQEYAATGVNVEKEPLYAHILQVTSLGIK